VILLNEKQKEHYKEIIFEIKRVFSEVNALPRAKDPENKLLMIEKSEELLQLYEQKWKLKKKRYDEKLFCKTLAYILKHKDNPEFIAKMEKAYMR